MPTKRLTESRSALNRYHGPCSEIALCLSSPSEMRQGLGYALRLQGNAVPEVTFIKQNFAVAKS